MALTFEWERSDEPLDPAPYPTMETIEWAYIQWVLAKIEGNKVRAAEILGINPSTLYRKIDRYGPQFDSEKGDRKIEKHEIKFDDAATALGDPVSVTVSDPHNLSEEDRIADGTNLIPLDPDVADLFPNAEAVNGALRALGRIIKKHARNSAASGG